MNSPLASLRWAAVAAAVLTLSDPAVHADRSLTRFDRLVLTEEFRSEGACFADIDGDGDADIVSGPFWYEGPNFVERHAYTSGSALPIKAYSEFFFTFAHDFNADGRVDILAVGMPGRAGHWFENPGKKSGHWNRHLALAEVSNESPALVDISGDGQPDLVCVSGGAFGYAQFDTDDATTPWRFTAITPRNGYGAFTHGLGVGDVNGDGRQDLLETNGWWEQTAKRGDLFRFHPMRFAQAGGAQMYAYDFDGDGDNDVVSVLNAHAYGLSWFENRGEDGRGGIAFESHAILTGHPLQNEWGLAISQMHGVALVDMDGDGVKDIVTGKRYYAHGGGDPGAQQLAALYWFRTIRGDSGVAFEPWQVDLRSGVGTQLTVGDVNGDALPDVVVGNKLGTHVFLNRRARVSDEEYEQARPKKRKLPAHLAGTQAFASHVRATEPLSPQEELATFVLPAGFSAQLVAAEPDIAKPMNLAFDARGRLWVSSSLEYPYAAPADRKARDTIKVLEDKDGDGRADVITTFADDLNIPIGLYPYKDGVVCWSIPNIWFLRDTDGDGRADRREKLYGPFGYERDTHGMCNAFTRGLDGWLYACHGFNNISTVRGADGNEVRLQSGNVFRMRLDGSRIEEFSHGQVNPFGLTQDRFGDILTADCHTKPITLLQRDGWVEQFGRPHDGIGFVPRVMEHMHGSTAIAGIALGEATSFPAVYRDSVFGGNVTTGRVNRNRLVRGQGNVRAVEESDFVISSDPWFRPVDVQVGPDGALYVADFYNRIIGHYEVPLDHPGRDRHRGRVWRITYDRPSERRDAGSEKTSPKRLPDLSGLSVAQLAGELSSPLSTRASLAADRLADAGGVQAIDALRKVIDDAGSHGFVHALWALHRLDAAQYGDLRKALSAQSPSVRVHALRVIEDQGKISPEEIRHVIGGLQSGNGAIVRAAAAAARTHPSDELVAPLLARLESIDAGWHQARYAVRLALRENLRDGERFERLARSELSASEREVVMELCLALKTASAARFVIENIASIGDASRKGLLADRGRLREVLGLAAEHATESSAVELVAFVEKRFPGDPVYQADLLNAMEDGLSRRGVQRPAAVRAWALRLARHFFGIEGQGEGAPPVDTPLGWTPLPHPETGDAGDAFAVSTSRRSEDGVRKAPLHSSFPKGEKRTGVYRSDSFELADRLEFFVAGHDGYPGEKAGGKNFVRLRDAKTHVVLRRSPPPRNDVAHRRVWDTSEWKGREVYVEIVDGDTAGAYAWLAVGRFSITALNPSRVPERRRAGAEIVGRFGLLELRGFLVSVLRSENCDSVTRGAFLDAIEALRPDKRVAGLSVAVGFEGIGSKLRRQLIESILDPGEVDARALFEEALKTASAQEQAQLAEVLAADREAATMLLALVESGKASPRVLVRPRVREGLDRVLDETGKERVQSWVDELPPENERLLELIVQRKKSYLTRGGSRQRGAELFQKSCSPCHRVADVGGKIAPQLDGIGNRGLDRVVEDLLAPNRNVDEAFRATTIVLKNGSASTVLVRREEGEQLVVADTKGEEVSIALEDIAQQIPSRLSPMPSDFAETMTEAEFRDLLAYLLSLRAG